MKLIAVLVMLCVFAISVGGASPRVQVTAEGGLLVDGKPFLPIFVWAQPSSALALHKSLGINTLHPGDSEDKDPLKPYLDPLQANGMMALLGCEHYRNELRDHPAILAWTVEHEPDGVKTVASGKMEPTHQPEIEQANYTLMKQRDPHCLTWNIFSAGFYGRFRQLDPDYYRQWLRWTDITSFDFYPITGWNQPTWLPQVGLATGTLVGMARKNQPVFAIIEASDQQLSWTAPETRGPTAPEMRAEIWSAIANGARGIGYFTIAFGRGKQFQWNNLTDEIKAEMKRSDGELTELSAPIVLGKQEEIVIDCPGPARQDTTGTIQAICKLYRGKRYLIAVNDAPVALTPTFHLPGASVTVWHENRTLPSKDGQFTDRFAPLEVHIYVVPVK